MNYKKPEWRKSMQLKLDYNNMMADFIGAEHGYTDEDIAKSKKLYQSAFKTVSENRGKGMMGWTELPYNQKEIVADIIATAKDIKKKFDNFVVLGIAVILYAICRVLGAFTEGGLSAIGDMLLIIILGGYIL